MSNSELLNETLDLLKDIKLEHGNTDNCISNDLLEQAIKNLEEIQGNNDSEILETVLKVLGKLISNLPEIRKLLGYLAEL